MPPSDVRLQVAPYDYAAAERLREAVGVSHVTAQVLVRRGLADPARARTFLDADVRHPLDAFGGLREGAARILAHVERGSRITVHGDYDVDGVSATAVLVRALRTLGADVDWYLPSRIDDGYGLALATVERLAARGTGLLVTVDCAITAVEEVAAARAAGLDVVVTDHHSPRADGRLPDAPIVHPSVGGYPCPELCATGVAHLLARALLDGAGLDPAEADADLDLVALATVADCVPLVGENRRLVREGLRALASTRKPGLQALMEVARVDPSGIDAGSIGFRLAPRINAAGRLHRADAGLELLLTADVGRARAVAAELDSINVERRDVETRILFEAEKLVAATPPGAPAYVLAADGWHPGVIGIVASRIAERHHRPAVLIALDGEEGTGSGRSIPAFDLLAGLQAASADLLRYGGHRAAAGLTIARGRVDAFREAFVAHAAATLTADDLRAGPARRRRRARRRAAPGTGRGARAARPVRDGQPGAGAARAGRAARRPASDGGGAPRLVHARRRRGAVALRRVRPRQLAAGGARRAGRRRRAARGQPLQRRGRAAAGAAPRAAGTAGADRRRRRAGARGRLDGGAGARPERVAAARRPALRGRPARARRRPRAAGAACRPRRTRRRHRRAAGRPGRGRRAGARRHGARATARRRAARPGRRFRRHDLGGARAGPCRWRRPTRTSSPSTRRRTRTCARSRSGCPATAGRTSPGARPSWSWRGACWPGSWTCGPSSPTPSERCAPRCRPRDGAGGVALTGGRGRHVTGDPLAAILRGGGAQPRSGAVAGRLLRVLSELGLIGLATEPLAVSVPAPAGRTALERSPAFRAYAGAAAGRARVPGRSGARRRAPAPAAAA